MKLTSIVKDFTQAYAALARAKLSGHDQHIVFGYLGEPGVGKTAKIKEAAKLIDARVMQMLGSALAPTDIVAMMPDVGEGMLVPMFNSEVPWAESVGEDRVVWFIDEATNIHPEVWKSFQKLIHERELFGKHLGENVIIVLAGNRASDKAASSNLSTAVYNRVTWREWVYDNDEYVEYLADNYNHAVELCAYITMKPLGIPLTDKLTDFGQAMRSMGKGSYVAWASPRSVERVALRMELNDGKPLSISDMAGDLGEGRAVELYGFMQIADELPAFAEILAKPDTLPLPNKVDHQYALLVMLVHRADKTNFVKVRTFVERFDIALQVLFLKLLNRRKTEVISMKEYASYVTSPAINKALAG